MSRRLHRSLIVFPALALAVTVGCVSSSGAAQTPEAKKTTTTLKKKIVPTTIAKGATIVDPTALADLVLKTREPDVRPGFQCRWCPANESCDVGAQFLRQLAGEDDESD